MTALYAMGILLQRPPMSPLARFASTFGFSLPLLVILAFWVLVAYTLISVARWANGARKEREAYYKTGSAARIAQAATEGTSALEILREQERIAQQKRREGQKLGGLISVALGVGMIVFIHAMQGPNSQGAFLIGLIPVLIGAVLVIYAVFLAPKS